MLGVFLFTFGGGTLIGFLMYVSSYYSSSSSYVSTFWGSTFGGGGGCGIRLGFLTWVLDILGTSSSSS